MAGVYLSYPFCAQKCSYCNFASGVFPPELERRYVLRLASEIRTHSWEWRPETVYLGGGTPSSMDPESLRRLLDLVPGKPWLEATLETAPGSITPERAWAWAEMGVNRVSLGAQSFVEREIRLSGRKHTAARIVDEVRILRDAGIGSINIDLIAGLAAQTEASWSESLDWIARIEPPHVSVYMLEVDEDSRLGKEMLMGGARYAARQAPDEDQTATFYEMAVDRLASMGIHRYEISNFARPGFESGHNLKYWKLEPYVGFGADAHSFDGRMRRQNAESVREYLDTSRVESTEARLDEERFFVGLRLIDGIRPSPAEWLRFERPIQRFLDAGLLATESGALRLTDRGVLLSNEVFQEFVNL